MQPLDLCAQGYRAVAIYNLESDSWEFITLNKAYGVSTHDSLTGRTVQFELPENVDASELEAFVQTEKVKDFTNAIQTASELMSKIYAVNHMERCLACSPAFWPRLEDGAGLWNAWDFFCDSEPEEIEATTTDDELVFIVQRMQKEQREGLIELYNLEEYLTAYRGQLREDSDLISFE